MHVLDMLPLTATYNVTLEGGKEETFNGPLFMLWSGLTEFLRVIYPTWKKVEYVCVVDGQEICRGSLSDHFKKKL